MMIARWQLDARFGHKDEVIKLLKRWNEEFGAKIGWTADKVRMTSGSIGVAESRVASEIQIKDLAELNEAFEKLGKLDGHAAWGKEMEPLIVSGSNRWEIHRVV
jgi:hypothetical protein